jgi:hypothetical protein
MRFVGIDPGHKGGLALVDAVSGALVDVRRMPIWKRKLKSGKVRELEDPVKIADIFRVWNADFYYLEDVNGFGMAATSSFSFGRGVGVILGVVGGVSGKVPTLVSPQTWKGSMGLLLPKKPHVSEKQHKVALKQLAVARAKRLFPARGSEMDHDGCAEAALIATYGVLVVRGVTGQAAG